MSTYLIGDVHGCFTELRALLAQVNFNIQQDTLWLTGDLVARGSSSLAVLRYLRSLGSSVRIVLGNHDLHLLAVYVGLRRNKQKDRLTELLNAYDIDELINWLRHQPLLQIDHMLKLIMVHAGISPQWDIKKAQNCAHEIEDVLSSNSYPLFLNALFNDALNSWNPKHSGLARLRFNINTLTRMRYCLPHGQLDMIYKDIPENTPFPLIPWFRLPRLIDANYAIVFGHWSSLQGAGTPIGIYALDTGCCWGGKLTLLRWEDKRYFTQSAKHISI
ncbi:bis(5'-nucleosyl)-tetraphosphatase (symmetrical) ApaH [Candidatus Fukatsuia anoeciicola]|uniref:bis(5'-nucleosyl)-tetraphosphatase (symmetrical) ApaH n=1 Tax=Candidatus Fukatsuia anoeciicola TaxID=2994492 RepID=UPI003463FB9E